MNIVASPVDPAAFAPFGMIIDAPRTAGERRIFSDSLPAVSGLALQFHVNAVAPSAAPITVTLLERHPHAAQAFVPMDVSRYVVTVAPAGADGAPDLSGALSIEMPGTQGVIYHAGVWHAGMTALDRTAHFAVLMYRGAPDDDLFHAIDPVTIRLAQGKGQS